MAVKTIHDLAGLAVMTLAGGEKLGRVHDLVFQTSSGRVTGFLIDGGGLFAKPRFLPTGQIQSVGADALTIASAEALGETDPARADPEELEAHGLEGRPIMNESGIVLGKISGTLLDTETLTVPGFVVATGFLNNALHGRPTLPLSLIRTFGKDSLVVPDSYDPNTPEHHAPLG